MACEHVALEECWELAGKKPCGVTSVDVSRGDAVHTEVRPRLVARQIDRGKAWTCLRRRPSPSRSRPAGYDSQHQ